MSKYINSDYNIITLFEYYKNIQSYQFSEIIELEDKKYTEAIYKDYLKDFYCEIIDNGVEHRWNENLSDEFQSYKSEYDYIIIDTDSLKSFFNNNYEVLIIFLVDFVYYLDMEEGSKFEFINSIIRYVNTNYIIKLARMNRNIQYFPINLEEIPDGQLMLIEEYDYEDLILKI